MGSVEWGDDVCVLVLIEGPTPEAPWPFRPPTHLARVDCSIFQSPEVVPEGCDIFLTSNCWGRLRIRRFWEVRPSLRLSEERPCAEAVQNGVFWMVLARRSIWVRLGICLTVLLSARSPRLECPKKILGSSNPPEHSTAVCQRKFALRTVCCPVFLVAGVSLCASVWGSSAITSGLCCRPCRYTRLARLADPRTRHSSG